MEPVITGIQQVGIGCANVYDSWKWYRKVFGTDVPVFDDEAQAKLMTRYTAGEVHTRQAVLAMNLSGGGGFEIWQYKSRIPQPPAFTPAFGDLGINVVKIKTRDVEKVHNHYRLKEINSISQIKTDPSGEKTFFVKDPHGNLFQVVKGDSWFGRKAQHTGGVCGVSIGVSDIDKVIPLYMQGLGFDEIVYDKTGHFEDFNDTHAYRRVLLRKAQKNTGAFSKLLGHVDLELIQSLDRKPLKIFENRLWGDLGFIHVCFDTIDMDALKERLEQLGYGFTVDSANSFDMGEAAGRFSYIEDPDGTWIEFVQTHKVPVMKKWGWYIQLKNRKKQKPLPNWMLKAMALNRVKD
jgi:catechol 2,3-dioxygenase-like lactoylglutathione lyase family enzyme